MGHLLVSFQILEDEYGQGAESSPRARKQPYINLSIQNIVAARACIEPTELGEANRQYFGAQIKRFESYVLLIEENLGNLQV